MPRPSRNRALGDDLAQSPATLRLITAGSELSLLVDRADGSSTELERCDIKVYRTKKP